MFFLTYFFQIFRGNWKENVFSCVGFSVSGGHLRPLKRKKRGLDPGLLKNHILSDSFPLSSNIFNPPTLVSNEGYNDVSNSGRTARAAMLVGKFCEKYSAVHFHQHTRIVASLFSKSRSRTKHRTKRFPKINKVDLKMTSGNFNDLYMTLNLLHLQLLSVTFDYIRMCW